jgi:hypothetical protein
MVGSGEFAWEASDEIGWDAQMDGLGEFDWDASD